jgi:hypothetical protein
MRHTRLEHRFVQHIPGAVDPGVLYISMDYGTAAHSCCCGCGEEVVTPFTPTDWKMTFDGETVTLSPSIGNWSLACRSHYVIKRGRVIEAGPWTDGQVEAERRRDRAAKARYYGTAASHDDVADPETQPSAYSVPGGFWRRLWRWMRDRSV